MLQVAPVNGLLKACFQLVKKRQWYDIFICNLKQVDVLYGLPRAETTVCQYCALSQQAQMPPIYLLYFFLV